MISDPWSLKDSFLFVDWEVSCHTLTKILSEIPGSPPQESFGKKVISGDIFVTIWETRCYIACDSKQGGCKYIWKMSKTTFHYTVSSRTLWPNCQ